ncbi:MAG: YlxR family protein [Selenomonadaceae bacterium]|nr:YlxR family protein [Selenomonadaceae bacterium]
MSKGKTAKGTAIKKIEMRRCVVCRQVRHKSELIRVVKSGENFSVDESGKAAGRGAYVCKSSACAVALGKRRNFDKIFKVKLPSEIYEKICAAVE